MVLVIRNSFSERHVPSWSRGSAPDMESTAAKRPCHCCVGNLQRTTYATSAVDNLIQVYLQGTPTLKHACLSLQLCQAARRRDEAGAGNAATGERCTHRAIARSRLATLALQPARQFSTYRGHSVAPHQRLF